MAAPTDGEKNSAKWPIRTTHPNISLQVTADNKIKLVENPVRHPGPGEVLLHIRVTGICGSDMHLWKDGRIGPLVVEGDYVLGHEAAGVVLKCGDGVTNVKAGDHVAIEPGVPCESCFLCRDGRYNLCEDVAFAGVYPHEGTCQRYKVHPAKWLHKIPSSLTLSDAALLEPLSVALHGIETGHLSLGRPALICGAGPIGLVTLASARASGAHPLVITDVEPRRLAFAREFVPGVRTYQVDLALSSEENARKIRRLFSLPDAESGGDEENALEPDGAEYNAPRVVLECTGVESSVVTACFAARRGGTVLVIGVGKAVMNNIPFMHISLAEIDLRFINRYHDTWPAGINLLRGKILDLRKLVTHTFPLENALEAFHTCSDTSHGSIKIHVVDEVEAGVLEGDK